MWCRNKVDAIAVGEARIDTNKLEILQSQKR